MATLGNQTTGFLFSVSTWGDLAGGSYTVPSPGILVQNINAFAGDNGTSQQARLYIWKDSAGKPGQWLIHGSGTFTLGSLGWKQQTSLSSNGAAGISNLFLPAGTVIWIGVYCAGNTEQINANAASGGGTEIGNTSDGDWSDHGVASLGQMAAYITYTPAGVVNINTGTPGAPVWTQSLAYINQGTPGAPNWVAASEVDINTGTPGSPIWTPGT